MTTLYIYIAGPRGSGKTTFLRSLGNADDSVVDAANGIECRQFVVGATLSLRVMAPVEAPRFDHPSAAMTRHSAACLAQPICKECR
ncbi:MAG: hypothetical protein J7551_00540 [Chloroflexi bacterium]|jgi:energy-coupling factor transporter ATP-binding protein EcfA2|nr:hypothetical protein [Chloroflexota bacterium]